MAEIMATKGLMASRTESAPSENNRGERGIVIFWVV